ncbi:MAG: ferric reductase-like transmembrane domain-containing protein, partial [Spirochaeta sp.]
MKKQIIVFGVAITALVLPAAVVITEAGDNFLQPDQIMQIHGLWAVVLLMFQFILTSRVRFLDRWIGLDRLIHAHRFIGIAAIAAALVHTLMYSIPAALQDYLIPELPDDWAIAAGMLSLTLLLLLGITAAAYRKLHLKYDTWRRIHQTAYIILPLVLLHAYFGGTHLSYHPLLQGQMLMMTAVVAGLLLQRLFRTIRIRRNPQAVTEVYRPTHDTTSVRFTRPEGFSAQPGQFAILRFHGRELKEAPHPYTLSDISNPEYLEITAKAIGDFSSEIPRLQKRDTIYVDGPHGIFTPVPTEKSVLWIAGG